MVTFTVSIDFVLISSVLASTYYIVMIADKLIHSRKKS